MLENNDIIIEPAATQAPHDPADVNEMAAARTAASDASAADAEAVAEPVIAVADGLDYKVTVEDARKLFSDHNRKVPAARSIQQYCADNRIAAKKLKTSYGAEWVINEVSLMTFIAQQLELKPSTHEQPPQPATQAPQQTEDPNKIANATNADTTASDASAAKLIVSDADAEPPLGDQRRLADMLIENARLLERVEGRDRELTSKDQTIAELKDDRKFLREELTDRRQLQGNVKDIATQLMQTITLFALGSKQPKPEPEPRSIDALDRALD